MNAHQLEHVRQVAYAARLEGNDEVFEKYPSWEECERSGFFTRPLLETYFGLNDVNQTGSASYAKCVKYGIGREVLAKMLEGNDVVFEKYPSWFDVCNSNDNAPAFFSRALKPSPISTFVSNRFALGIQRRLRAPLAHSGAEMAGEDAVDEIG